MRPVKKLAGVIAVAVNTECKDIDLRQPVAFVAGQTPRRLFPPAFECSFGNEPELEAGIIGYDRSRKSVERNDRQRGHNGAGEAKAGVVRIGIDA